MKLRYVTPLVAAAGAAVAIIAAPTALAADNGDQSCTTAPGVDTVCSSPGNVQINDSQPVQFGPQYPYWGAATWAATGTLAATAVATGNDAVRSAAAMKESEKWNSTSDSTPISPPISPGCTTSRR